MITPFDNFIYRIPQSSFEKLETSEKDIDKFLLSFFLDKHFQFAIYLASPDLYTDILKYIKDDDKGNIKYDPLKVSSLKYILRICSRATPFGLFSGCGIGEINDKNLITPQVDKAIVPRIRLDMEIIGRIIERLLSNSENHKYLELFPNNTIYKVGNTFRYVDCVSTDGIRSYKLSSFESSTIIKKIIKESKHGRKYHELVDILTTEGYEIRDSETFISELIYSNILISNLEPITIGKEYESQIRDFLNSIEEEAGNTDEIYQLKELIKTRDTLNSDLTIDILQKARQFTKKIFDQNAKLNDFQIDAYANSIEASISKDFVNEVKEALLIFLKFCTPRENQNLERFKKKFVEKYEDSWVPISEIVDVEMGIGYGAVNKEYMEPVPFVDDIPLSGIEASNNSIINQEWDTNKHTYILNKINEANAKNELVIEVDLNEIKEFKTNLDCIPPTFNAFIDLQKDENDRVRFMFGQIGATSASCIISRFAYLDENIVGLLKEICDYESIFFKDCIVAEINHITDYRLGNITQRPQIRDYEIAYFSGSNLINDNKLFLDDILLSVVDNKIIIYSKKYKKRIIPRLSNAHNYSKDALPAYKLLCDLQETSHPSYMNLVFDIKPFLAFCDFIPRIQYKNAILFPATWYVSSNEFKKYFQHSEEDTHKEIKKIFAEKKIPTKCQIIDKGTDIYINIDNPIFFKVFKKIVLSTTQLTIKEFLLGEKFSSISNNSSGNYITECIIPFRNSQCQPIPSFFAPKNYSNVKKEYTIGDEWAYFKVYGGIKTLRKVMRNEVFNLLTKLERENLIKKWFFLTYTDPEYHLRIRILLENKDQYYLILEKFNRLLQKLQKETKINRFVLDTYSRELNRYLGKKIEHAETIFHIDSKAVSQFNKIIYKNSIEGYNWLVGLLIVDTYLSCLNYSHIKKYDFSLYMRDRFAKEFKANKAQRRILINKYKNNSEIITNFFNKHYINDIPCSEIFKAADLMRKQIEILLHKNYKDVSVSELENQTVSFIHMSLLRLFSNKNRLQEYATYAVLEQYYKHIINNEKYRMNEF